ncbi:MAG TPA: DegT/DnrJ/EryC1/StrS family aminotransferase [Chthoniobacterales bacterium]|nr:DegT/DnrJ/EryC1/StrS family aminotransferase [Chthoniobacterales bacterium]
MIRPNDFKRQWAEIGPAAMAAVERVGSSGRYILGREVEAFEGKLAEFWGVSHAVGVANGMDAIEIALRALDLQPGQKVLTTPFSAFATTLAILRAGGVPAFVDVDDNGNVDLEQCRDIFTRDRSIRFCVPVHLYGNPLDLEKLDGLKQDFDLAIVEDCAQAIGAKHDGRNVGTVGQAAATSFYPTKNLGAFGDGGALLTNDPPTASRARALRNYGQSDLYLHDELGLNSRLDELHAAVLSDALLPNLERWTEARRQIASRYLREIQHFRTIKPAPSAEPVWHLFPIFVEAEERDGIREHLLGRGIASGVHYPRLIPDQPAMQLSVSYDVAAEPVNARRLAASELSLPIHPFLREEETQLVVASCSAR